MQAKRTEESTARQRAKKRQERAEKRAAEDALLTESEAPFAYLTPG
jgi:hypothetical protein